MRLTFLLLILLVVPAKAAPPPAKTVHPPARPAAEGPKALGKFDDWTAATHSEGGQTVCYAFTRATASNPALPGRGDVVLTVTERPGGRDAVAITAGFTYATNATVAVDIDQTKLDFYTAQRSAFARDGHAAVAAFDHGRLAVAHSPGPHNAQISDAFSLRGFTAAYAAINKVCPAK
jgi:hypothetical protein